MMLTSAKKHGRTYRNRRQVTSTLVLWAWAFWVRIQPTSSKSSDLRFRAGAGAKKISTIVGSKDLTLGRRLIDKFLSELPRLKSFRSQVEEAAQSGKVKGLDGRLFNVRSPHKAVNTI